MIVGRLFIWEIYGICSVSGGRISAGIANWLRHVRAPFNVGSFDFR